MSKVILVGLLMLQGHAQQVHIEYDKLYYTNLIIIQDNRVDMIET